jgi:aspartyl-tRNA(Asn)/glutamyl-tRNA(Gln) amidotransferase subunit A
MLKTMAGHDPKDSTSANIPVPDFEKSLTGDVRGLRIGIPKEYLLDGMPSEIEELWEKGIEMLRDAGAIIVHVNMPHTKFALPTYYIIAPAEASSNLARYDGVRYGLRIEGDTLEDMYEKTRSIGFGTEVKRRIMIGTYVLSAGYYDAYYLKAQRVRSLIKQDFDSVFEDVDALLTPTAPSDAFSIGENDDDPIKMYLNDIFTVPASLTGVPAISVPIGLSKKGLPLGLQVIGKMFDEDLVLRVAGVLELMAGFNTRPKGGA